MGKNTTKPSKANTQQKTLEEIKVLLEEILQAITEKTSPPITLIPAVDPQCQTISVTLNWLGIPANLKGYALCESAIDFLIKQKKNTISLNKELYPMLSEKFDTTASRADRAIIHAIHSGYSRNPENFLVLFPKATKCPSVSEFLFRVTNYLEKGC